MLAGTQGGKTVFGPPWLYREIQQRGPGDYLVVTPTYPLLGLKALPTFLDLFDRTLRLGDYRQAPTKVFTFSAEGSKRTFGEQWDGTVTRVMFGHAADPDSLESATAKAAWLDEAGQTKFHLSSWEAIIRRLSIAQGRVLVTTTPYDLGWLKQSLYDPWVDGDPSIDVIRFDSTENPAFPVEEYDRAKEHLPRWKFDMFYRAIYTVPAGLIYDSFDIKRHVVTPFAIPDEWPRYLGLDFGNVNTAALFYAKEPSSGKLYLYREYTAAHRTAREHVGHLLATEPGTGATRLAPLTVGGAKAEGQWREEFAQAGLFVREPLVSDVEVGIQRVYSAHRKDVLSIFDHCKGYLSEKMSYSRSVDENGNVTEDIEDKHAFHFMDAERYIIGWVHRDMVTLENRRLAGRKVRKWA